MEIFKENSYKNVLKQSLLEKKSAIGESHFDFQGMAKACRIQKTYLSRVLNGSAHLNGDQLFLALEYLGLTEDEKRYTQLLHEKERSEIASRRKRMDSELARIRDQYMKTEKHLPDAQVQTPEAIGLAYYLNPNAQLVHLFLTVKRFAEDRRLIQRVLGLSAKELSQILLGLQESGIIRVDDGKPQVVKDHLHLSSDSMMNRPYQTMFRLKALENIQNGRSGNNYSYSLFFSATESVRDELQARFLQFLRAGEKLIRPAPAEKIYQLQFDLLDWNEVGT